MPEQAGQELASSASELLRASDAELISQLNVFSGAEEEQEAESQEESKTDLIAATVPKEVPQKGTPKEVAPSEGTITEELLKGVEEEDLQEKAPKEEEKKEKKPPLTEFQVYDEEGELEVPDLKFTFKANGKVRENVPLEKVVLLAQQGIYNHEREQQFTALRSEAEQIKDRNERLVNIVGQYEAALKQLLNDPEAYEYSSQEYLKQNTPEKRAERAESKLAQERRERAENEQQRRVVEWIRFVHAPSIEGVIQQNPSVNQHEVMGRYHELLAPLLYRGQLPPSRLAEAQALVENELTQWARAIHEERTEVEAGRKKEVEKVQKTVVEQKRSLARAVLPKGRPVPDRQPTYKPKATDSATTLIKKMFATEGDEE